jgi:hypothetical protein
MNNQIYQTTDTPEAAYLVSCGFNYREMSLIDNETIAFIFDANKELLEESKKFKAGKALVEPTKFLYNYKKLLSEIRSLKKKYRWQKPKMFRSFNSKW